MDKPLGTVTSVGITFLVTLLLNTGLNYYTGDRGTIGVSRLIPVEDKVLRVVTIENYSKEFLDGVALEIPASVSLKSLVTDTPVVITETPQTSNGANRLVKIGQISPRLVTRIIIPATADALTLPVRVLNAEATGLSLRHDDQLVSPMLRALISAFIIAAITAAAVFFAIRYFERKLKATDEKMDSLLTNYDRLRSRSDDIQNRLAKQRLLLQARLFDFSKELDYWRNTIKTILLNSGADNRTTDSIIQFVTKTLGTFGTQEPAGSFESVRMVAGWLAEAERESSVAYSAVKTSGSNQND